MSNENNNIIPIKPSARLYYERAFQAFHSHDIDKGIKYFKRGISLANGPEEAFFGKVQLALMFQHSGDFKKSYELLDELMHESYHSQPDLYYYQAVNCTYLHDTAEAKELLESFIEILSKRNITNHPYEAEAKEMITFLETSE